MSKTKIGMLLLALVAMTTAPMPSAAQLRGPQEEVLTPHLVLARLCTHEASMPVGVDDDGDHVVDRYVHIRNHAAEWGGDCYLIHQVLLRGARRMMLENPDLSQDTAYVSYAIHYSRDRLLVPQEHDTNRWAAYLLPGAAAPRYWPTGARWSPSRWHWVWDFTAEVLEMTIEDLEAPGAPLQCEDPVHDWGGRMDGAWAASHGRERVQCEGMYTANTPYRRPHLVD